MWLTPWVVLTTWRWVADYGSCSAAACDVAAYSLDQHGSLCKPNMIAATLAQAARFWMAETPCTDYVRSKHVPQTHVTLMPRRAMSAVCCSPAGGLGPAV